MFPVKHRKIFYILSAILIGASLASVFVFGLRFSIEFTGGSLLEVSYADTRPDKAELEGALSALSLGAFSLREAGDQGYTVRTRDLTEDEHQAVLRALGADGAGAQEERYTSIGPTIGQELRTKAIYAFLAVVLAIVLYIAFVFRKVSKPVSSWMYGGTVVVALLHDIIIPIGIFVILGYFMGVEMDMLFLTAMLVILGYSISDTVVIFDRIRERLRRNEDERRKEEFALTVGTAVSDTYARSINTSLTTLIALGAIYFFGGESTEYFALAMIIGVAVGAYSSICIAAPLLVSIEQWQSKRKKSS